MVKQYLAAVLEDLIGEYVLNISKENLKLAALKGKIKLDNVELDGDYIGSYVLGAFGLQGFGVLSCWARSLQINIPWRNLDDPTTLEIHGLHLVCVPLLPTTATRMYYGGGISGGSSQTSFQDVPRCSLRTRAKRSAIARFERNFFSGRMPGEGPQLEKENDNDTLSYNGRRQRWSLSVNEDVNDITESTNDFPVSSNEQGELMNAPEHSNRSSTTPKQSLSKKITSKIWDNLITSINDVHIRFEVPEGGLDMSLAGKHDNAAKKSSVHREGLAISDQRAFAFGLTLERLSVKNVADDLTKMQLVNTAVIEDKASKTIEISNMSIYWDNGPSFLLTESDSVQGLFCVPVHKLQKRIAEVMKQMSTRQDPDEESKKTLNSLNSPSRISFMKKHKSKDPRAHEYICTNISQTIHTTFIKETSGNSPYFVELLPSRIDLDITSQQHRQYQLLKNAILSQQRFDTMLHGRPKESPLDNPRAWWKYAILCVKHRPNSRPWSDVQTIVRCRKKYIDLVVKNLQSESDQSGFHGGLSFSESQALLELENLLPLETLLVFHLLALRQVFENRCNHKIVAAGKESHTRRSRGNNSLSRLWKSVTGSKTSSWRPLEDTSQLPLFPPSFDRSRRSSRFFKERGCCRVSTPPPKEPSNETTCRLQQCEIRVCLLDFPTRTKIAAVEVAMRGKSFDSGDSNEEYIFEMLRFEVFDFVTSGSAAGGRVLSVEPSSQHCAENDCKKSTPKRISSSTSMSEDSMFNLMSSQEEELPLGIVCRLTAVANEDDISFALVAHPATVVWNAACADAVADFFYTSTPDVQVQFLNKLRSAATPGAHQQQLNMLFPSSLAISIDVHAPKLWLPVSPHTTDGALYLDAGKLRLAAIKPKKTSETRWESDLSDIQVKFSRGESTAMPNSRKFDAIDLDAAKFLHNDFTVIYPFNIGVTGIGAESVEIPLEKSVPSKESVAGEVSVAVGKIRLNLVDAEELAMAAGRFYASEMIRLKTKARKGINAYPEYQQKHDTLTTEIPLSSLASELFISLEHIEVALESYAPRKAATKELSKQNRTYRMEIDQIRFQQRSKGLRQFSRLTISDVCIVQLAETQHARQRLSPSEEPQHHILGKKIIDGNGLQDNSDFSRPHTPKTKAEHHPLRTPKELRQYSTHRELLDYTPVEFIRACHFHDGENHIHELEFDVTDVIIRVTPTSIVDLKISFTRLAELIQLTSKEMERKVHEGRRRARALKSNPTMHGLQAMPPSPSASLYDEEREKVTKESSTDSSIIYRVTFKSASVLVGRPASEFISSRASKRSGAAPHDYVVQITSNTSVLIQSVENPDSSGSKTAHVSLEDLTASISRTWAESKGSNYSLVSPTEVDFRAVYQTVDEGSVVSQDFSFNCESIKCCVLPHYVTVILSITRKVVEKLKALDLNTRNEHDPSRNIARKGFQSAVHMKQKGSGIATSLRFDINSFSLVSIHAFKSAHTRPFLDANIDQLKLRLDGVRACLIGELDALLKISFYHHLSGWEHLVEPIQMHADIEQMPDEMIFNLSSTDKINVNFSSYVLQELSNLERLRKNISWDDSESSLKPVTSSSSVCFENCTGIDLTIRLGSSSEDTERQERCVQAGECFIFPMPTVIDSLTLCLVAPNRKSLSNLPLLPSSQYSTFLFKLSPASKAKEHIETYELEPVVEFVMENQRLRSSVVDVYSIDKGRDLLSSSNWSPEFNSQDDRHYSIKHLWQKPYLEEGDAPEFSDQTGRLECTKESINLPTNWIWANDWEVEINDEMGVVNDADGWEYEADFETFTSTRRFYKRGDACRRRRWIRHRMITPPKLDDPFEVFKLVWELRKEDDTGNISIKARSHLSIQNTCSIALAFFGYCEPWNTDQFIAIAAPGATIHVPFRLASATHLKLAVPKEKTTCMNDTSILRLDECFVSNRMMILSCGLGSNRILRTFILCEDPNRDRNGLRSLRNLHFMLRLTRSTEGSCDICVGPALTVVNLLPCQMQCQVAESISRRSGLKCRKVVQAEEFSIAVGKDAKCLSLDCRLKPHLSIRAPGYRWSAWTKIVNRANSETWQPLHDEQETLFDTCKDDAEHAKEYKTILHLDNKCAGGPSINLIMSVETGHSPIIRIYAQYWILDKSGYGLRFTDNFDIIGQKPDPDTLRKSFLTPNTANTSALASDMKRQGSEWSLGMNGMTLYFSKRERVSFSVATDEEDSTSLKRQSTSRWSSFIDISKVMPKTVISVTDNEMKRYELAYNVTLCPSHSRTLMVTFFPRYQIVNLLQNGLYVVQDGACDARLIPPQSWVPFHWENGSLAPKIRIASQVGQGPGLWSRGCISLDQIGITAMRVPSSTSAKTFVVQVEVRLATKKQGSAVVVVVWSSIIEKSNPLYAIRNESSHTIFCSQPLTDTLSDQHALSQFECVSNDDIVEGAHNKQPPAPEATKKELPGGSLLESNPKLFVRKIFRGCNGCNLNDLSSETTESEEFVWTIRPGDYSVLGFEKPEMSHILQWTCLASSSLLLHGEGSNVGCIDIDLIGSTSTVALFDGGEVKCEVKAEQSTKVVIFSNAKAGGATDVPIDDLVTLTVSILFPCIAISIIDNCEQEKGGLKSTPSTYVNYDPREILLITTEGWLCSFSQTREGSQELEVKLDTIQIDNFIFNADHPVLLFTPSREKEPFAHCSIVRSLNEHDTLVISYAALRLLEIDISLDRKTAETLANFLYPLRKAREQDINMDTWITTLTLKMSSSYSRRSMLAPRDVEKMIHSANSGRVFVRDLHLHPVRLSLTFTQEWMESSPVTDGLVIFQVIRGMASITDAPLTFPCFLVANAFESPQSLLSIIQAHYSSELTYQVLTILGSLTMLKAPVEFVTNVGTGVIRFFYEPINALVHSPEHFLEGLESGTHHLARGVFTGFVRGAANMTSLVNNNLVTLAADEAFADTRRAYQKQLNVSRARSIEETLSLAGACVARGVQSGANGIWEQPAMYASRHGTFGLVKGFSKAVVGAVVKPIVGIGDAAVVVLNHVSDATCENAPVVKTNKRMRRALPQSSAPFGNRVNLIPYDTNSAIAQRIVTGSDTVDDAYLGHVTIPSHLIIASRQCLWAITKDSREPWCISWTEISHFTIDGGNSLTITVFSAQGPQTYVFDNMSSVELADLHALLSLQAHEMGNMNSFGTMSYANIEGMNTPQAAHIFGSANMHVKIQQSDLEDVKVVEKCKSRVKELSSNTPDFLIRLDQEIWLLINSWTQMFTGLSSRRCVSIGILNGTLESIQIKSSKLVEGGSLCSNIPSREYNEQYGTLGPGGAIIFFAWGAPPSLLQPGRVVIEIETNAFSCTITERKGQPTTVYSLPCYEVGFLEKSYDESGWWAKYWLLIRKKK